MSDLRERVPTEREIDRRLMDLATRRDTGHRILMAAGATLALGFSIGLACGAAIGLAF